ncbi:S-adenosyl-L-methionine-dependent methyltransferase [Ramicandelaber brevisporus]|nr:S-adenosyl-L-methionine-dependent methyltransferase [Ramicandelaber brevisporus]
MGFWDPKATKKSGAEEAEFTETRKKEYTKLVNAYYNLVTDFYSFGWGTSYHFARKYKGEGFKQSIARHEHFLASLGQFKPGQKVLDVGCGVGGPAREIARFAGCNVTGINNNDYQIALATKYSERMGVTPLTSYTKGDFMEMPFADESFDGAYAIEATCHAPKLAGVYGEIFRVLKPGGVFAVYEWCTTDKYDPENPVHRRVIHEVELGDGIPKLFPTTECLAALKEVGFEIEFAQNMAESHIGGDQPWYTDLSPGMFGSLMGFAKSPVGRRITAVVVRALEFVRLAPPGAAKVGELLNTAADALHEGGKLGVFTPMYCVKAIKPKRS